MIKFIVTRSDLDSFTFGLEGYKLVIQDNLVLSRLVWIVHDLSSDVRHLRQQVSRFVIVDL